MSLSVSQMFTGAPSADTDEKPLAGRQLRRASSNGEALPDEEDEDEEDVSDENIDERQANASVKKQNNNIVEE